jgi:Tfp pilus assembly protein PilV
MRDREAGFTMIEVMVAMLLTAIAIIGILALYMTGTKASGYSRHTTEATALAEDKVEKLRTLGSAAALTGSDVGIDEKGVVGSGMYTRNWTETVGSTFATIVVSVSWSEDGIAKAVTVNARRGL